ncbi:helix-turn-helix domain-containing protein [Kineosporia rhizophila]|uniref:helix-turn-helix domain-containing protein n=1 Tax=Kineosporia rhizophila TaxID=84633 RepID=UPI0022B7F96C|nr:ImmA/IrrE family metallo-endopeptidase [Kineosporia rhizophila]
MRVDADRHGLGDAVAQVRQVLGFTQAQLAERAGLSQGYVSRIEGGVLELTEPYLSQIAEAMWCPIDLLTDPGVVLSPGVSCVHHRRKKSRLSAGSVKRIEGLANLTSLTLTRLIAHLNSANAVKVRLPQVGTGATASPTGLAQEIREMAGIGGKPVASVAQIVEGIGVPIMRRPLTAPTPRVGSVGQDGISMSGAGRHPVIIVNEGLSPDRERFTIAHELGHIVLHQGMAASADDEVESEANDFAARLLLPRESMDDALEGMTEGNLRSLLELKNEWGVSISALIEQGKRLGKIDSETYRKLRIRLARMGWDKLEPGDVQREELLLLGDILERLRQQGLSETDLARISLMRIEDFRRVYISQLSDRGE